MHFPGSFFTLVKFTDHKTEASLNLWPRNWIIVLFSSTDTYLIDLVSRDQNTNSTPNDRTFSQPNMTVRMAANLNTAFLVLNWENRKESHSSYTSQGNIFGTEALTKVKKSLNIVKLTLVRCLVTVSPMHPKITSSFAPSSIQLPFSVQISSNVRNVTIVTKIYQ